MKKIWNYIWTWVSNLFNNKKRSAHKSNREVDIEKSVQVIPEYTFKRVDDEPELIEKNVIYIVGQKGFEWVLIMECPCGCKDQIMLNTLKDAKPSWRYSCYKNGAITIAPSVHRKVKCKSHYTITKGQLQWWGEWEDHELTI
ncbi:MAG: hypothetical protein HUJ25_04565 [Crocinitomicaceae bacterium]|nr:hypothetical protein [Crocinitomicaceae bacterium]